MTLPVERPPAAVEDPPPAAEAPDPPAAPTTAERLGIEERTWLLAAVVVAFIVLAFAGMFLLTALGGGSGYVPWGD
jgi:uncharacterized membrane protein